MLLMLKDIIMHNLVGGCTVMGNYVIVADYPDQDNSFLADQIINLI